MTMLDVDLALQVVFRAKASLIIQRSSIMLRASIHTRCLASRFIAAFKLILLLLAEQQKHAFVLLYLSHWNSLLTAEYSQFPGKIYFSQHFD